MTATQIPPVQCLVTFEALARLRHVGRAAEELCVTASAVSHRMRQLEEYLGVELFARDFSLTTDGASYLGEVRAGLAILARLARRNAARPRPRVRLAAPPTFCRQFLMPRLESFRAAWPDVDVVLNVAIPLADVTAETADLEVRFGPGGYRDCVSTRIQQDRLVPACSPASLRESGPFNGFKTLGELSQLRLIRSPLEPWAPWFAHCGLALPEPAGSQFNDIGLAYDAAASGFGAMLVRLKLGAAWLDSGRLVPLSDDTVPALHDYYLCHSPGALERWECAAFAEWLTRLLA